MKRRSKVARVRGSVRTVDAYAARINEFNSNIVRIDGTKNLTSVTDYPITLGEHVAVLADWVVEPGKTFTLHYSGPPGATVGTTVSRQVNSGGHQHPGGPAGVIQPPSQVLGPHYPQNQTAVATAPMASGLLMLHTHYSQGSPSDFYNTADVRVPGLVAFAGGPNIVLTGSTAHHPQNHFGLPALNSKIVALSNKFFAKFNKKIFVNDMSLIEGGLFDIKGNWNTPHVTHRDGRRVDINSTSMSAIEKEFFKQAAHEVGFTNVVLETKPEHWHLEI